MDLHGGRVVNTNANEVLAAHRAAFLGFLSMRSYGVKDRHGGKEKADFIQLSCVEALGCKSRSEVDWTLTCVGNMPNITIISIRATTSVNAYCPHDSEMCVEW